MTTVIGIDISKGWFDCYCSSRRAGKRFKNTPQGWKLFLAWAGQRPHAVMEASGPYYLGLASWLTHKDVAVSVVNPLVIRRYGQMQLSRTKTDAKDAALIAAYGVDQHPKLWAPPSAVSQVLRQLMSLREGLLRQRNILTGQAEAFGQHPMIEPLVLQVIDEQRERIQAGLDRIDRRLEALARQHWPSVMERLLSIPGIGKKTAILLLCITDGFSRFEDSRKLASYVGICPRIWESGSSVKGRGSICKLGCAQLRKLLYMCSWSAKTCNPACRQMYERLKAKGKPERVIKVAIAHKLLRQAFAVGKTGQPFDEKLAMTA